MPSCRDAMPVPRSPLVDDLDPAADTRPGVPDAALIGIAAGRGKDAALVTIGIGIRNIAYICIRARSKIVKARIAVVRFRILTGRDVRGIRKGEIGVGKVPGDQSSRAHSDDAVR